MKGLMIAPRQARGLESAETADFRLMIGERGHPARSGRHLADRPESRNKESSLSKMRRCRTLAGRMPARTGRMPALPRNATLLFPPQFSNQRRRGAEEEHE